ncbi:MAG: peptidylprolyl isomerase [Chloroherpetonaceae bacterium]|nr:peptidylprolyl isomerase [Chloroherpetonaceae bacterium]
MQSKSLKRFYGLRHGLTCIGLVVSMLALMPAASHAQLIDGVVAVVGDEVILKSDVDSQVALYAYQNQIDPRTPGLWMRVLNAMIDQKILVAKAKLDSIQVNTSQLDALVTERINFIRQRLGSDEEVVKYFGKTIPQLRIDLREELKAQQMAAELQRKKFANLTISNEEVVRFYETYKDSLPAVPAEVELAHILIRPKADSAARLSALEKIRKIEQELRAGADFAELARRYSEDPGSARSGGDLGYVKRGEFVKRFEEVAFSLREGQISKIVETEFGFHIIQLLDRRGESVHTRHILVRFNQTKRDDRTAIARLDSIRAQILAGELSFGLAARLFSEDERTAPQGGDITSPQTGSNRIPIEAIDPSFRDIIDSLKVGEISAPRRISIVGTGDYAYHIVLLKYKAPPHKMNLEMDYTRIKNFALQKRQAELYEQWIEQLRKEIYWQIKL